MSKNRSVTIRFLFPVCAFALLFPAPLVLAAEEEEAAEPWRFRNARDLRELAHLELAPGVLFGVQVEILFSHEEQGDTETSEISLDGLELALTANPTEWSEAHLLVGFDETGDFGDGTFEVEEAFVRFGGTDEQPFFVEAGRLELPFGEFNSQFIEDPLTQLIGETLEDAVTVGFESEWLEISLSAYQGDVGRSNDVDELVAALFIDPIDEIEVGIYWRSDLGEADELELELRERVREAAEEQGEEGEEEEEGAESDSLMPLRINEVDGAGAFLAVEWGDFTFDAEIISALTDYRAGILAERRQRPLAWTVEAGWCPWPSWSFAVRYDQAEEMPFAPEEQIGVTGAYALHENIRLAAEFLHAEFADDEPDLELVLFQIGYVY